MDGRKTGYAMREYGSFNIKRTENTDAKASLRNITLCLSVSGLTGNGYFLYST
jgi:hypothetical protein